MRVKLYHKSYLAAQVFIVNIFLFGVDFLGLGLIIITNVLFLYLQSYAGVRAGAWYAHSQIVTGVGAKQRIILFSWIYRYYWCIIMINCAEWWLPDFKVIWHLSLKVKVLIMWMLWKVALFRIKWMLVIFVPVNFQTMADG